MESYGSVVRSQKRLEARITPDSPTRNSPFLVTSPTAKGWIQELGRFEIASVIDLHLITTTTSPDVTKKAGHLHLRG